MTTTARHALILIEHDGLAGAIMDHGLTDGDSAQVCARLKERGIPYLSYSGYEPVPGASPDAPYITKPVSMDVLMSAMEELLSGTSSSFLVYATSRFLKCGDGRDPREHQTQFTDLR